MQIILLSHGDLSQCILQTAKMIIGDVDDVLTFGIHEGEDIEKFENNIKNSLDFAEGTLLITDLIGGSPFLIGAKILNGLTEEQAKKVKIITGMNLGMVIEILSNRNLSIEELIEIGKNNINILQK